MILESLIFIGGVGLLVAGAWLLVEGGSKVAAILGVPPVVVGLTVVAFGTSAPELFVSLAGALRGSTGLVLGNVIGSNVANLGLILGCAAVLRPVIVEKGLVRREVPLLLAATVLFVFLVLDGQISRYDAGLLVAAFGFFMWLTLRNRNRTAVVVDVPAENPKPEPGHRLRPLLAGLGLVVLGIVGLAGGGHFIVTSSLTLAARMGISETVVGLTLVAVGTSLPELATTLVAAWKDKDDLALGNIVGSNLFNLLAVAGPVGLIRPLQSGEGLPLQLASMVLLTALVFAMIVFRGGDVGRKRGGILLIVYLASIWLWVS